jgi:hypothetical protein
VVGNVMTLEKICAFSIIMIHTTLIHSQLAKEACTVQRSVKFVLSKNKLQDILWQSFLSKVSLNWLLGSKRANPISL